MSTSPIDSKVETRGTGLVVYRASPEAGIARVNGGSRPCPRGCRSLEDLKTMKFLIISLLLIPSAFAQMPSVPCIPPPAPAATPATAANQGQGRGPGAGRVPAPQSAAEVAEIAKLMDLPAWGQNLSAGDYSNGPAYPTAPELAKRAGVP